MWYEPGNIFEIRQMTLFEGFGFIFWNFLALIVALKIWPHIVETARIVEREKLMISHHIQKHFGRGGGALTYTRHGNPAQSIILFAYLAFTTDWLFKFPTISIAFGLGAAVTFVIWQWLFFSEIFRNKNHPGNLSSLGSLNFGQPDDPSDSDGDTTGLPPGLTREPVQPSNGFNDNYQSPTRHTRTR